jgi:hypothetical protein
LITEYLLHTLEISFKTIEDQKKICKRVEDILRGIVIPNLSSEHDVVKSRACSVIATFCSLEMTDKSIYAEILPKICQNMQNKNLPVRVNAVMALNTLLEAPEIKEAMGW